MMKKGEMNDIKIGLYIDHIEEIEKHMLKLVEYLEEMRKDLRNKCNHSRTRNKKINGGYDDVDVCKFCGEDNLK
jgi:hypothetical protein